MRNPKDLVWAGLKRVNAHDGSIGASGGDGVNTCVPVAEMQIADAELAPVRSCGERGERDASALRRRPVVASGLKLQRQPGGRHLRATPSFGVWAAGAATMATTRDTVARGPLCYMASSQGDVRSSPMAYPAVRPLPKPNLPLPLPSTARLRDADYLLPPRRTTRTTCSRHRPQDITGHTGERLKPPIPSKSLWVCPHSCPKRA